MNLSKLNGFEGLIELFKILHDLSKTSGQRILSHEKLASDEFGNSDQTREFYFYIQENYHKKISLKELADQLNMSAVSLNRFVKKTTHTTFVNYLNKVRIEEAGKMLILEDFPISEIAYRCGFNNMSNFNRVFKKLKLSTPLHYRKLNRSDQRIH
ncbi:helix-turn-helix domain-containing protein [Robiginitalea myxolifaciens]|nr:AraC family transcriptional regulator [Robiginitalea myxolifaciens]